MNQLSGKTKDELEQLVKQRTQELNLRFLHTKYEDETSMLKDWRQIKSYANKKNFFQQLTRLEVGFADEADNYRIGNLQGFLKSSYYPLSILCLIGHGVKAVHAKALQESQVDQRLISPAWRWRLDRCNTFGEDYNSEKMCKEVNEGDLAVFHCGFLTPHWVYMQLEQRDVDKKETTVIILIDSCFSKAWIKTLEPLLKKLEYTRVIVQTACEVNEESYGQYFIPLWVKLQEQSFSPLEDISCSEIHPSQHPSFYVSHPQHFKQSVNKLAPGCVEVEIEEKSFKFFDGGDYFHKLAQSCVSADQSCTSCGIPSGDIPKLLEAFRGNSITFRCFRLKVYRGKQGPLQYRETPLGLLLIDWKKGNDTLTLFLHLHFNEFAPTLKLGRLNNIYVVPKDTIVVGQFECILKYQEDSGDTKDQINLTDDDKKLIAFEFTQFVSKYKNDTQTWCTDKGYWNMKQAEPLPFIRSRSAMLESLHRVVCPQ